MSNATVYHDATSEAGDRGSRSNRSTAYYDIGDS